MGDWKSTLPYSLAASAAGAGAGYFIGNKKNRGRRALIGALAGAAVPYGISAISGASSSGTPGATNTTPDTPRSSGSEQYFAVGNDGKLSLTSAGKAAQSSGRHGQSVLDTGDAIGNAAEGMGALWLSKLPLWLLPKVVPAAAPAAAVATNAIGAPTLAAGYGAYNIIDWARGLGSLAAEGGVQSAIDSANQRSRSLNYGQEALSLMARPREQVETATAIVDNLRGLIRDVKARKNPRVEVQPDFF